MVLTYDSGLNCGVDMLLKVTYLELFDIAVGRNTRMAQYLDYFLRYVTMSSRFIRLDEDWELEPLDSFLDLLYAN